MTDHEVPLSSSQIEELRSKSGASRLVWFLRSVARSGELYVWGDDDGVRPMEDADGKTTVPVWPHPLLAQRELIDDGEEGERAIAVDLDAFLHTWLPDLERSGEAIAVFPAGGRIAVTLTPAEFRSKIAAERKRTASPAADER